MVYTAPHDRSINPFYPLFEPVKVATINSGGQNSAQCSGEIDQNQIGITSTSTTATEETMSEYAVNLWGSRPGENDDCWTGAEFATRKEALACYRNPGATFQRVDLDGTAWIEIDGPEIHAERRNPTFKRTDPTKLDREWQSEIAWQAGMAGGCDAYNDAMGY